MSLKYESFQDLVKISHELNNHVTELEAENKLTKKKLEEAENKLIEKQKFIKMMLDKIDILLQANDILSHQK